MDRPSNENPNKYVFFDDGTPVEVAAMSMISEGEADQMLAIACQTEQLSGSRAYVYAQDSDFFVFRDISYIPFGTLQTVPSSQTNTEVSTSAARVYRRKALCRAFKMTEVQFFNWSYDLSSLSIDLIRLNMLTAL